MTHELSIKALSPPRSFLRRSGRCFLILLALLPLLLHPNKCAADDSVTVIKVLVNVITNNDSDPGLQCPPYSKPEDIAKIIEDANKILGQAGVRLDFDK